MKTVYKFPMPIKSSKFELLLPKGWKFLCVMFQDDKPFLWAEVVDGVEKNECKFALYGTGQEIADSATYLTTYNIGPFVLHLYLI